MGLRQNRMLKLLQKVYRLDRQANLGEVLLKVTVHGLHGAIAERVFAARVAANLVAAVAVGLNFIVIVFILHLFINEND